MKLRTFTATLALASLSLYSHMSFADSAGGNVTVLLTATANDPIEGINLDQKTPIFITPIGADGLFADALAAPITEGPILTVDAAAVSGDADPFIDLNFSVTNTFNFNADITVTSLVPLSDVFGPDLLVDASSNIEVAAPPQTGYFMRQIAGTSMFEALVDGVIVETIFDADVTGPVSGNVGGSGFLALPTNDLLLSGAIADESIGITSHFTLGPGDTATFRGSFAVLPAIPEPTSLMLLGLGVAMIGIGHRKSHSV